MIDDIMMELGRRLFEQHGVNTNMMDTFRCYKFPLHVLSEKARYGFVRWSDVQLLLKHLSPPVAKDALMRRDGFCNLIPLHLAAEEAPRSMIDLMLSLAPDAARVKDYGGDLPLQIAVLSKNIDAIELLVERYPEAILESDNFGTTALHYAASYAPRSVIDQMLSKAPDAARIKDKGDGALPLHYATGYSNVDAVELLI